MGRKIRLLAAAAALVVAGEANAQTYSLSGDFSFTNDPNGVWSFTQGTTALAHQAQPTDGNTLNPAAANGYFGVGPTFSTAPFILKVSQNGAATSPYTNGDFLAGDVIVHSTNPGTGADVFVNWTAPSAGMISFSSSVWYAHSPVTRSNDISDLLGGVVLDTVTVTNGITRSNAITSLSGSNLAVTAGEVLAFRLTPTAGQSFGSLAGISETINFTAAVSAVPELATWAMTMAGLGTVGVAMRRRRMVTTRVAHGVQKSS